MERSLKIVIPETFPNLHFSVRLVMLTLLTVVAV